MNNTKVKETFQEAIKELFFDAKTDSHLYNFWDYSINYNIKEELIEEKIYCAYKSEDEKIGYRLERKNFESWTFEKIYEYSWSI